MHPHAPPSTPGHVLAAEHQAIGHLLDALDGMAREAEGGRSVAQADLDAAIDAITEFADKCHHAKEEKSLFPVLRASGPAGERLVRMLEGDHRAARKVVGLLKEDSAALAVADTARAARLAHDARLYTKLLRAHIDLETRELIPMADALPAATRDEVAHAFERIEREETGAGIHERHERTIHALHERYA